MKALLLVFLGGGLGSLIRYLVSKLTVVERFPLATFLVNIIGCFLIGVITGLFNKSAISQDVRLFLAVGFCGGFTTFSTFINENYLLLKGNDFTVTVIYLIISIITGYLAVWGGYKAVG
ncbi:MAG: fluoride efflux transporter CrcB [Bacteroidales bacterium]|nr:fluoride efflux transporter CrcB [Bacteroidales bacterium]